MTSPHGTNSRYINNRCYCEACTEAHRVYCMDYRARKRAKTVPSHVHGTNNGYTNYGCKCVSCRAAHAHLAYLRRAKARSKT